ncbi:MAG: YtxH domain-containing protein [bacterium]
METRDNNLALIFAFTAGAACGVIAGILLAPQSGEETRKKIREASLKIKEGGSVIVEKAQGLIEEGREKVEEFIEHEKGALKDKKSIVAKAVAAGKKAMDEEIERIKEKA